MSLSNDFLDMIPKAKQVKKRLDFYQNLHFKDSIKKVKTIHKIGKKKFVNSISDKGLVSRIYKELLKLNNKKTNNPIKK